MYDGVVRLINVPWHKWQTNVFGGLLHRCKIAGHASEAWVEKTHVLLGTLGCISVRIHADHCYPHELARIRRQSKIHLPQFTEGSRANVWAKGVAEKYQCPLSGEEF
ncbi:hypothetical protein D3C84_859440 [compost metagenome]